MKKKGFTLIELLAVIVILAVIALITVPLVLNMIEDARRSAAVDSAYGYINSVETYLSMGELNSTKYSIAGIIKDGTTKNKLDKLNNIKVKGKLPNGANDYLIINKNKVTEATLTFNGYETKYNGIEVMIDKKISGSNEQPQDSRHSKPQVGDYVRMTPTLNSFITDKSITGYSSTQEIKPQDLNVWVVIKTNQDGTIEMVSKDVSNEKIYFMGTTAYKNYVSYLNILASKYANSKYTIATRHMGFNGQTEILTDTSNSMKEVGQMGSSPWKCSTGETCTPAPVESQGGGDLLYQQDIDLVTNAIGTATVKDSNNKAKPYWLASRVYSYYAGTYMTNESWYYCGRIMDSSLNSSSILLNLVGEYDMDRITPQSIRPIVTLKSDITYKKALGTESDPFILE